MVRHRLAVVIPALNEAATIAGVVGQALAHGTPVVVDDGSGDDTARLAAEAGAVVVRHAVNRGYDQALNSGAAHAASLDCEYFVTLDADGQHDPAVIGRFLAALEQGADVVVGVRDRRQRFSEVVFGCVTRLRWGIIDPLAGMKGYRMSFYREIGFLDSYGSIGTELMLRAARQGCRIQQVPVLTRTRVGEPRFGGSISANIRILRACWLGLVPPRGSDGESGG